MMDDRQNLKKERTIQTEIIVSGRSERREREGDC